ncbi:GntR family transcriptional regulator [Alkalicoccus chagannorensis]|uniref:GntR family transcriptional regulator n=1 Tax=Alkalicoccus chagannorensis TaxID=427072 RepID=UPI000422203E|nr:GntR family transcriptional regulator [Alkalicoccus chagannorensis]
MLSEQSSTPLYRQIAHWLEGEILAGRLQEGDKAPSQYQLAEQFHINPATAGKGITALLQEDILYKQRGLGTFIAPGAYHAVLERRRSDTLQRYVRELVEEAAYLEVPIDEVEAMIRHEAEKKERDS